VSLKRFANKRLLSRRVYLIFKARTCGYVQWYVCYHNIEWPCFTYSNRYALQNVMNRENRGDLEIALSNHN
jgi:hypothetical protein